jgi:hypothetical protein
MAHRCPNSFGFNRLERENRVAQMLKGGTCRQCPSSEMESGRPRSAGFYAELVKQMLEEILVSATSEAGEDSHIIRPL